MNPKTRMCDAVLFCYNMACVVVGVGPTNQALKLSGEILEGLVAGDLVVYDDEDMGGLI